MFTAKPVYADKIKRKAQYKFAGVNKSPGAGDGELADMQNLCSDAFPVLSTRPQRRYCRYLEGDSLFSFGKLVWRSGSYFYYDGFNIGMIRTEEKKYGAIGDMLFIFPDKRVFHKNDLRMRNAETFLTRGNIVFQDGQVYGETARGNTIYSLDTDWALYFSVGDGVTISGSSISANNKTAIVREISGSYLRFSENTFVTGASTSDVTLKRAIPDMDYICEHENRLWGCKGDTIYASKLGDPYNWNVFDGLETDSWAWDSGTQGDFTGCISYLGYVIFFKEDRIFKIYGNRPSNFEAIGAAQLGVISGGAKSLAVANETLFYLSKAGICAYTGGIPSVISDELGMGERFREPVAGSDGLKYYITMKNNAGDTLLYVYDTRRGMWHIEDEGGAIGFAYSERNLYMIRDYGLWTAGYTDENTVMYGNSEEYPFEWSAEFADWTDGTLDKKAVSKIQIRLELEPGAQCQAWIRFDDDVNFREAGAPITASKKRSYILPVVPGRADHFRIRLTGIGQCKIYAITREYYTGSYYKSKIGRQ